MLATTLNPNSDVGHSISSLSFFRPRNTLRYGTVRVDENLRVTVYPTVELVVCVRGFVDVDVVANNEAGLRLAGDDHVTKVPVVCLDVALAGSQGETLTQISMLLGITQERKSCSPSRRAFQKRSRFVPFRSAHQVHRGQMGRRDQDIRDHQSAL